MYVFHFPFQELECDRLTCQIDSRLLLIRVQHAFLISCSRRINFLDLCIVTRPRIDLGGSLMYSFGDWS